MYCVQPVPSESTSAWQLAGRKMAAPTSCVISWLGMERYEALRSGPKRKEWLALKSLALSTRKESLVLKSLALRLRSKCPWSLNGKPLGS